ncbi:MAG: hypothetical protein QNI84_11910 [Henriciella sp.]|nr:hypothetical protein [Henriciella sp.]
MLRGLPASIIFHAAVVGAGYVSWPYVSATTATDQEMVIIPVELVDLGAFTNIAPVREPDPEPEEEIAPEVPEEEPEDELPPEDPDPVDETLPEDEIATASEEAPPEEPDPQDVVPDLDAEPEVVEEEVPKPEEPEPEPPVQKKSNALDSLLNDADSTFQSERQTRKREEPKPVQTRSVLTDKPVPQEARKGAGERTGNTTRLENLFLSQIAACGQSVKDQPNWESLIVTVNIQLDMNGNIDDLSLVNPKRRPLGRQPMGIAIDRALRAVRKCAPYSFPRNEYEEWREVTLTMDPTYAE